MYAPIANGALRDLTPEQEEALAQELVRVRSEEELDQFIPLLIPAIKAAAPLLMNIAGPLLKGLAGGLLGGGSSRRPRAQTEQEHFLGGIFGKLFGELAPESEEEEQFLGNILGGLLGGEIQPEEEQFLGSLLGGLFGRGQGEGEYVQEQFLGGILKGILGGEIAGELERPPAQRRIRRARRFVRLAARASRHAAAEILRLVQSGQRPTENDVRRIIIGAFITAVHHRHRRPAAAPATAVAPPAEPSPASPPPQGETLLEAMTAGARPLSFY